MTVVKVDTDCIRLEPEEIARLMAVENYGDVVRLARFLGRSVRTLAQKRSELLAAARVRAALPKVFQRDDGMPYAARMAMLQRWPR